MKFYGKVLSISDGGLGISLELSFNMIGSIIDVKVYSESQEILSIIGSVINQNGILLGVTILCLDTMTKDNLDKIMARDSDDKLYFNNIRWKNKDKILVLGAGGGKILAQLKMLQNLEEFIGESILDYFNIFAGVSSGGLILALVLKYKNLKKIEELLKSLNKFRSWNFLPIYSLLNKNYLERFINQEFRDFLIESNHILYLQYRDYKTGNYESLLFQNNNFNLSKFLIRSISIPILFGLSNNYSDGAVGFFINPTELLLRFLRMKGDVNEESISILYLDSGFDPKVSDAYKNDIFNQMLWTLRMNQRDSILLSVDRIFNEFEKINFYSYFFTYSKVFDLLNPKDMDKAVLDIELKKHEFISWLKKIELDI
jgi:hypothetical protein